MNVVEANRERELWLRDEVNNVYFIPQGWCDAWSVVAGHAGGLNYIDDDGTPRPEIYCYAPTHTFADSPVDTLFVEVATLQSLVEIDEATARTIHPQLAAYLDAVNRGEI